MNEGKHLSRGLHYTHIVLPRTSPNDQGLLLTISSVTRIESLQYKKVQNLLNSVKENGCDLEHLNSNQVFLGRNMILNSVNKTE